MYGAYKKVTSILLAVGSFLTSIILTLSMVVNTAPQSTDSAEYLGGKGYAFTDALVMGQGITTDGEYFYTSGTIAPLKWGLLAKVDMETGEILHRNNFAIPAEIIAKGCDHIGGISYHNGYIYASVEGKPYVNNFIVLYEAETLEYTGIYYELEQENHTEGVPWVAVDAEKGYFYTAEWNHATRLNVYDLETGLFSHYLDLTGGDLHRIQGCEVFDGVLYASSDDGDAILNVYAVDLDTGAVSLAFTRQASRSSVEAEGMTVSVGADGLPVFHVLDYDKLLTVFIRSYVLPQ